eukprot:TRINITY_DN1823_c0_g1_i1.p1 TRINITY_DN1823_c0_g1~~TRINITY_DN1823_c0_g1_i1.p1  ORF type:complete len:286 (-),score=77.85 TRINITY_DN1823_c0_g1_i1:424-1230(-)
MKTQDPDDGDLGQVDAHDDEQGDEYVDYDYDYDYDYNDNDDDQGDLFDDLSEDQDNDDNEDDDPDYSFSEEEKDKGSKHTQNKLPDLVKQEPKRSEEDALYQESDGDEYDFTPQTSKTGHTPVVQKKRKRVLSSAVKKEKEKERSKDTKTSVTRRSGISSDTPAHRAKRRKKSARTKTTTAKKKKSTASSPLTNLPLVGSPPATGSGGGGGGGGGTVVKRATGSPTSTGQSQGPYKIEICIYTLGNSAMVLGRIGVMVVIRLLLIALI